ncbi:MAG: hypothetical protein WCJ30_03335 [Deltaproteobacteria bacterium]
MTEAVLLTIGAIASLARTGLQCIPSGGQHIADGGLACVVSDTICSKPCATDADCASLGTGLICVHDCFVGSCVVGSHSP